MHVDPSLSVYVYGIHTLSGQHTANGAVGGGFLQHRLYCVQVMKHS